MGQNHEIARLYSTQKDEYAKYAADSFSWRFFEKPALGEYLHGLSPSQTKILDAGCGTGRTLAHFIEKGFIPRNIYGIDVNPDMISLTQTNAPGVNVIRADIEHLPLPNDHLDAIVCTHVLHYFDNQKYASTLRDFHRVLKPDGTILVITTHPIRTARKNLSQYFHRRWIMDHTPWGTQSPLFYRPVSDLVNLGLQAGLSLSAIDELVPSPTAQTIDPNNYEKYSICPSRLLLKFTKQPKP